MSKMPVLSIILGLLIGVVAMGPELPNGSTGVCASATRTAPPGPGPAGDARVTAGAEEMVGSLIQRLRNGAVDALLRPWRMCLADVGAEVSAGWMNTAETLKAHGIAVGSESLASRTLALVQPAAAVVEGRSMASIAGLAGRSSLPSPLPQLSQAPIVGTWPRGLIRDGEGAGRLGL